MADAEATKGDFSSLWEVSCAVPDLRRAEGKRYPLAGLLLIAVAAMLPARRDPVAIVRWGRKLAPEALRAVGITRARAPAPSVWCELFRNLDVAALERLLGAWVRGGGGDAGAVAIDGKRLRGSRTANNPGVHQLAA
jgi:hypothetical protein